jgi:DNA excision repair protein ERCC-2
VIGAIIVGPALPNYNLERELLRGYYEKYYGSGFEYAYTYPAMAKVIQSAGRVIRSENDRGLIVLMDRRFIETSYVETMPDDWFDASVNELVSGSILTDIQNFWKESEQPNESIA